MSIQLKSPQEIAKLREANLIVADVLDQLEAAAKPGLTTWELNEIADQRLKHLKGRSAFLGYHGYPAVLCTSVNEVVVHGIPRKDVVLNRLWLEQLMQTTYSADGLSAVPEPAAPARTGA